MLLAKDGIAKAKTEARARISEANIFVFLFINSPFFIFRAEEEIAEVDSRYTKIIPPKQRKINAKIMAKMEYPSYMQTKVFKKREKRLPQ
jgi:hypothetical protein